MTINPVSRLLIAICASLSLMFAGFLANPAIAEDENPMAPRVAPKESTETEGTNRIGDIWVTREHPGAHHERVDLFNDRIAKVKNLHDVNFDVLVRVVSWAKSPRKDTSTYPDGDRGIYQYRMYEYEYENGMLRKTGKWCVVQFLIEWQDGHADRGWLVTAYPVMTDSGRPKRRNDKRIVPDWLRDASVLGPVNFDVLY